MQHVLVRCWATTCHENSSNSAWHRFYKSPGLSWRHYNYFPKSYSVSWCLEEEEEDDDVEHTLHITPKGVEIGWPWRTYHLHHLHTQRIQGALMPCGYGQGHPGRDHIHQDRNHHRIKTEEQLEELCSDLHWPSLWGDMWNQTMPGKCLHSIKATSVFRGSSI